MVVPDLKVIVQPDEVFLDEQQVEFAIRLYVSNKLNREIKDVHLYYRPAHGGHGARIELI